MKELSTDNLLTIAEIADQANIVSVLEEFKNTKEKDPEKVGLQIFVKTLSGISKGAKQRFYELLGELTDKDADTVKKQSAKTTFEDVKEIVKSGDNAALLRDFFG